MTNRLFIALLVTIPLVGALVGGSLGKSDLVGIDLVQSLDDTGQISQVGQLADRPVAPRKWSDSWNATEEYRLDAKSYGLMGPVQLEVDRREHLYVVDFSSLSVAEFSPKGEKLRTWLSPDSVKLESLTDMDIDGSGNLWVSDNSGRRISVLDQKGQVKSEFRFERWPYRVIASESSFVVMHPAEADRLFTTYDRDGRELSSFGIFIEEQAETPLALDGWVAADGAGGFVYAGLYSGLLARYAGDGTQRFLTTTVDGLEFPKLFRNGKGVVRIGQDSRTSAYSLSVANDRIYVLGAVMDGFTRLGAIDAYDAGDGTYLFSQRLPEPCQQVVVTSKHLYTVRDSVVVKWNLLES